MTDHKASCLSRRPSLSWAIIGTSLIVLLAACGGANPPENSPREIFAARMQATATPAGTDGADLSLAATPSEVPETLAMPDLGASRRFPVPADVKNGDTVRLQCGTIYQGTLELNGKSDVTVKTVGTCGKAVITPARAITGWARYRDNIYSVQLDKGFEPVQVAVDGTVAPAAHWPNLPQTWATSDSEPLPSTDLAGATVVYKANQSVINSEKLASDDAIRSMGFYVNKLPFYVEGKLWMLDSPGEWAVHDGRLYLWTPDGQSPEGRVWAAADKNGINADRSLRVTIDAVAVTLAANGISGANSSELNVKDSVIANSALSGISAGGANKLAVNKTSVTNSRRNGIDGGYWLTNAAITNSSVSNTGMVHMPTPSYAGIFSGKGEQNRIHNVSVTNSSYHGIAVMLNFRSRVTSSVVDTACVRLTDCGGIYTSSRYKEELNLVIEGNTVTNVKGKEGVGIYLDDSSRQVTVTRNKISNNTKGMMLHSAFENEISYNTISSSGVMHMAFPQDREGDIRRNSVTRNTFRSTNGEQTFNMGPATGEADLHSFATIDYNTYLSTRPDIFARSTILRPDQPVDAQTRSFSAWKAWSGQDAHSQMNGRP